MATQQTETIFEFQTRPCVVLGEVMQDRRPIRGQRLGRYLAVRVRFIDGAEPPQGMIGKKTWGKVGKPLRGAQLLVWRRVQELLARGLDTAEAKRQAMAELAKGVLLAKGPE